MLILMAMSCYDYKLNYSCESVLEFYTCAAPTTYSDAWRECDFHGAQLVQVVDPNTNMATSYYHEVQLLGESNFNAPWWVSGPAPYPYPIMDYRAIYDEEPDELHPFICVLE